VWSVGLSEDSNRLVSASQDYSVKVFDFNPSLQKYELLQTLTGHADHLRTVVISRDKRRIVSSSTDFTVKVWDLQDQDDDNND